MKLPARKILSIWVIFLSPSQGKNLNITAFSGAFPFSDKTNTGHCREAFFYFLWKKAMDLVQAKKNVKSYVHAADFWWPVGSCGSNTLSSYVVGRVQKGRFYFVTYTCTHAHAYPHANTHEIIVLWVFSTWRFVPMIFISIFVLGAMLASQFPW